MKKLYCLVVVFICLHGLYSPAFGAQSKALKPLTLSTTNDPRTPLYQKTVQVLRVALAELGFTLNVITLPSKRSLSWSNMGKVDGELFRVSDLDLATYPNLIRVNEAIAVIDQSVIGKSGIVVNGWQSMQHYTIAYERGTAFLDKNQARFKGVILVDDFDQAIELIIAGRADITVTSRATAQRLMKNSPLSSHEIKIHNPPLVEVKLHTYINKQRHPELPHQLSQVLKAMKLDGRYDKLSQLTATSR
ncbi:transporter substrate-binding domain-containing protein [Pseudoalteromonas sp. MMG022]|uniref:substrate-binding periplasmic protein n=1 Tax=Pseudoalteromonas sp. MMG022 TaxID=2909978 RepID=UPI001F492BF5|nr:transporter substrate-binding domain-containing protein [Pseudoalteromonas sp. MMG022]MCF6436850.1 transporter substrate-binding domain-containing protein [Pseudoalteromonas sp. MMG022]